MNTKKQKKLALNVGTIGHVDHGKTTLTAALTQISARRFGGAAKQYDEIDNSPEERARGITIHATHVEWESARRAYAHVDCPGHADFVKNMIVGASQMDGAILLVDGTQGVSLQTKEHVLLARQVGVAKLVVFVNKVDVADPELVDLVELEAKELCARHGFGDVVVVRGSALQALAAASAGVLDDGRAAGVLDLVDALDRVIDDPVRDVDGPFFLPIEGVHSISGRGTVVTGKVERGTLKLGDKIAFVGGRDVDGEGTHVVTGIETFRRPQTEAVAGENVGLLIRGLNKDVVERGVVAVAPGSVRPHAQGRAELFVLDGSEGGRRTPFGTGYRPQFFFGATDVTGTVTVGGDVDGGDAVVAPGDRAEVGFVLDRPVALEAGMRFAVREGGRTVGAGVVLSTGS